MTDGAVTHLAVQSGDVRLHVAQSGNGPPVVLLHGFPDDWRTWRPQIGPLVEAGYSVWMPDLRGYNRSARPRTRDAYRLEHLVEDVRAVVAATGAERVRLAGHDWGGVIAWAFAGTHPSLLEQLVILNAPHPELYARRLRRPGQLLRSWYAAFFLIPSVPERVLAARDGALLRRLLRRAPALPAFTEAEIDDYVESLSQPGALTAALDYYRANARRIGTARRGSTPIDVETLVLWGERDPALSLSLLEELGDVVGRVRVHRIPRAGHWVHREATAEVNRVLLDFLGEPAPGRATPRARPGRRRRS
jgi:epoxide hydrolase 4